MSYLESSFTADLADKAKADAEIQKRQRERSKERGHECLYPFAHELFLDIDSFEALGRFHAALEQNSYIKSIYGAHRTVSSPSKKAGRFHVIVSLNKPVDKFERITLQALLGSDLSRELLSYSEAQAGCTKPTVFYELPLGPVPSPDDDAAPAVPRLPAGGASDY